MPPPAPNNALSPTDRAQLNSIDRSIIALIKMVEPGSPIRAERTALATDVSRQAKRLHTQLAKLAGQTILDTTATEVPPQLTELLAHAQTGGEAMIRDRSGRVFILTQAPNS